MTQTREEELLDRINEQKKYIAMLEKQIENLEKKTAELEAEVDKHNNDKKDNELYDAITDEEDDYKYKQKYNPNPNVNNPSKKPLNDWGMAKQRSLNEDEKEYLEKEIMQWEKHLKKYA